MQEQIRKYSSAPIVATRLEVAQILDLADHPIETLRDRNVALFCAIAHPDYFENTVANLGARVVARRFLADHADEPKEALYAFAEQCTAQGAELLLCTEKDRVKLDGALQLPLPLAWLKMRLVIVDGKSRWDQFIERAKKDLVARL